MTTRLLMLPNKVKLNSDHRYFDESNREYIGFSKLYDTFMTKPFNMELAAYGVAKSEGRTAKSVIEQWTDQRNLGVRIDEALDLYAKTGTYLPSDEDIIDGVKEVLKVYEDYHLSLGQQVVYSEQYRVAGLLDKVSFISNRKNCPTVLSDFKCFEKEIDMMPGSVRFLNPPFNHLANTKYTRICFQTSLYSLMLEEMTGRVPIRQFIHWIDPRSMVRDENGELNVKHKQIPIPYMKNDCVIFLETYKEQILALTEPKIMEAF